MQKRRSQWPSWAALLLGVTCVMHLCHVIAVSVDVSDTVQRNHVILFDDYGSPNDAMQKTHRGGNGGSFGSAAAVVDGLSSTRYVQLSNGSRFVCDTTNFQHHDPPQSTGLPLNVAMRSIINSIKKAGLPCTHVVEEDLSAVLCWDREVRLDAVSAQSTRILGRSHQERPQDYWMGRDAFGPYAATVYGGGEECLYTKQPTETELRFYCRYTEMENPVPFLTLQESSQCHFMLRVMSSKFCRAPQLDHAIETETTHCRMLE